MFSAFSEFYSTHYPILKSPSIGLQELPSLENTEVF